MKSGSTNILSYQCYKKDVILKFFKPNYIFYRSYGLTLNQLYRLSHIKTIFMLVNFKFNIGKESDIRNLTLIY
jgi:hypothetical protein